MKTPGPQSGHLSSTRQNSAARTRGARSNTASRYLPTTTVYEDDEQPGANKACTFYPDATRRLITRNTSPDINFDQSINAYKGCEHGCVYCFARPTHTYLDLSAGLDFETTIFYKTDVEALLSKEIGRKGYQPATIALGTNTDPYQPLEKEQQNTRKILQILLAHRHPVSIVTKGALIERDLDLLAEFAGYGLVSVMISMTTLDNALKTKLEPRAASPARRLQVVQSLRHAGVPVGVMLAPLIPWINDMELEDILDSSLAAGAQRANYILLRLPAEVKDLFAEWLQVHYPERASHVLNLMRDTRGGELYKSAWGERMRGTGPVAELLARRFEIAVRRLGLATRGQKLRTDLFRIPSPQLSLF